MAAERLQKLLARAGFGSRRACEELVTAGRVSVDGRIVAELGAKADLETQDVRLDGSRLKPERPEYWILNKPKDCVCTNFDPAGRKRPIDIMRRYTKARLFPVGRLDTDTKGLLLMTNDGPLTNSLTHPRYEVPKTYVATVVGDLTQDAMRRLRRGVWLAEGRTRPAQVRVIAHGRSKSIVEITIREGRNRQVRRMLARLEHNVRELVRTRIGRITLRGLSVGEARRLESDEIEYLKKLPEMPPEAAPAFDRGRGGPPRGPRPFKQRGPGAEQGRQGGPRRFGKRGPGDDRGRDRGPPRFDKAGPRRKDSGKFNRESKGKRPYPQREGYREKRSRRQHDPDGTRKEGEGFRGHEGRGGRRGRGRPGRPPFGGRRPDRHSPQ
jgi:23S rRNA pseudouridine2605 synthase